MRHIKFSSECLGRQWQRLLVFHILTEDKRASPSPACPAKQVGHTSRPDSLTGLLSALNATAEQWTDGEKNARE